jgi:putative addiction module component (TIGR02574 family)
MDIPTTLNEIVALSIEERIKLVQDIWDSIAVEQACVELTELEKQELDRRIASDESSPDNVMTWQEIRTSIKRK